MTTTTPAKKGGGFENVIEGIEHFLSDDFAAIQKVVNPVAAQVYAAFKTSLKGDVIAFIASLTADFTAKKTFAEILADAQAILVTDGVQLADTALQSFLKALETQLAPPAAPATPAAA